MPRNTVPRKTRSTVARKTGRVATAVRPTPATGRAHVVGELGIDVQAADAARIGRVVRHVTLRRIVLVELNAKRDDEVPAKGSLQFDMNATGGHTLTPEELHVRVQLKFATRPPGIEVTAVFALVYSLAQAIDDDDASAFGRVNAVFNAWPYWRELVQSVVTRMGLPAPMVPLLKM